VELPSAYYILLFIRGSVVNYSGAVCLSVKMYERVKYGDVYRFNSYCNEWCLSSTYILVCLLAGADVMPGVALWSSV
jgi:phosphatidylserine synthase